MIVSCWALGYHITWKHLTIDMLLLVVSGAQEVPKRLSGMKGHPCVKYHSIPTAQHRKTWMSAETTHIAYDGRMLTQLSVTKYNFNLPTNSQYKGRSGILRMHANASWHAHICVQKNQTLLHIVESTPNKGQVWPRLPTTISTATPTRRLPSTHSDPWGLVIFLFFLCKCWWISLYAYRIAQLWGHRSETLTGQLQMGVLFLSPWLSGPDRLLDQRSWLVNCKWVYSSCPHG
jgi:hypothetical protein